MDGEAGDAAEQRRPTSPAIDLPSVLARLDTGEPTEQRAAVATIRDALTDRPAACLPAVPKLRDLLERSDLEFHERVAYCLAELAAESPSDVAPSTDGIVSFAAENPAAPATAELLRCLATVAAERPCAVDDHAGELADVIDRRPGFDRSGIRALRCVAGERPDAIAPAAPVLLEALDCDDPAIRADACAALGDAGVEAATQRLERLARRDPDGDVRERADRALERLR